MGLPQAIREAYEVLKLEPNSAAAYFIKGSAWLRHSNAEEAARWLAKRRFRSLRLITSDWHMRRARYEFGKVLGGRYELITDAVRTEPSFLTLFAEYNKYVLRRLAVWADI